MKVLFALNLVGNAGPANANRRFVENWPQVDEVSVLDESCKAKKILSFVRGVRKADVVVSASSGRLISLARFVSRLSGKTFVGFCHGYLPYENDINGLGLDVRELKSFESWLDSCDLVFTNSALQAKFLVKHQPSLAGKVSVVNLGIDPFEQSAAQRKESSKLVVSVSGGTRPIKANEVVAQAVDAIKKKGIDARLDVYGDRLASNSALDEFVEAGVASYCGHVGHEVFVQRLESSDVFVMNSRHEPFGLSALDAVEAGASVLLSRNCGVAEVLEVEFSDCIDDCEDPCEVAQKILALSQDPNAERIYRGIDFEDLGWPSAALRLRNACAALCGCAEI